MTVPLLAMIVFSVDLAWMIQTKAELQSIADAAALAGATAHRYAPPTWATGGTTPGAPYGLMDGFVQYCVKTPSLSQDQVISRAQANSRLYAQYYAYQNAAGHLRNITLFDADVTFGFLHSDMVTYDEPAVGKFPNTVHVTVRMDGSSNSTLPLFFGPVLGRSRMALKVEAYATIFNGPIVGFNGSGALLPLAVDQNMYNAYLQYLASGSPASTSVTVPVFPAAGGASINLTYLLDLTPDTNQFPQFKVFPSPDKLGTAGCGWLSLNDSSVSSASLKSWATGGLGTSDLFALTSSTTSSTKDVLLPLPTTGNGDGVTTHRLDSWDWLADPGVKQSVPSSLPLNAPVLLPLFNPVNPDPLNYQAGTFSPDTGYATASGDAAAGSNLYLNIVGFAPVIVTDNNGDVYVEPSAVVPPGGIFGSIAPADSSASTFSGTFSIPRLTRPGG
jgi:hypothetical protein